MKLVSPKIQMIVGLGNPGAEYERTRHNAGQDYVEALSRDWSAPLMSTPKYFGYSAKAVVGGRDVRLLVPTTFMNRSGQAVAALSQYFKIPPESILVVHDELDLPPGIAKLKVGGGHGGHNGLRDIISSLGNNKNFARLRLGIGHPGNAKLVANYVLKRPSRGDQTAIDAAIDAAQRETNTMIAGEWEAAMRTLHTFDGALGSA